MNSDRHNELLAAFYQRPAEPPVAPSARLRFELESDRRIMDISRILWRRWPLAALYGRAWHGDNMIFDTATAIPEVCRLSEDIEQAVTLAFDAWLSGCGDPVLVELKNYDDACHGWQYGLRKPNAAEQKILANILPTQYHLLEVGCDIVSLGQSLRYYGGLHAPNSLIRSLQPDHGKNHCFAFYARSTRIFTVDVTASLLGAKNG